MSNTIYPTTAGITDTQTSTRVPTQELGEEQFLQILAVQLANQDPLEPMDDTDFIAQMAQFSSLEQMQALNDSYSTSQAYSMIGTNVVANVADEFGGTSTIYGRVTGVIKEGGENYLQVGSYFIPMEAVVEAYDPGIDANTLTAEAANLVGKNVTAMVPEDVTDSATGETRVEYVEVSGKVEAIAIRDNTIYAKLEGVDGEEGKEVPVAYITEIKGE